MATKEILKQWNVESESTPDLFYKVTLYADDTWGCACPHFINRLRGTGQVCKHINRVQRKPNSGDLVPLITFKLMPGNVREVTAKNNNVLLIPLIPADEDSTKLLATICYDLLEKGVSIKQIKEYFGDCVNKTWTIAAIRQHIADFGRYVPPPKDPQIVSADSPS